MAITVWRLEGCRLFSQKNYYAVYSTAISFHVFQLIATWLCLWEYKAGILGPFRCYWASSVSQSSDIRPDKSQGSGNSPCSWFKVKRGTECVIYRFSGFRWCNSTTDALRYQELLQHYTTLTCPFILTTWMARLRPWLWSVYKDPDHWSCTVTTVFWMLSRLFQWP